MAPTMRPKTTRCWLRTARNSQKLARLDKTLGRLSSCGKLLRKAPGSRIVPGPSTVQPTFRGHAGLSGEVSAHWLRMRTRATASTAVRPSTWSSRRLVPPRWPPRGAASLPPSQAPLFQVDPLHATRSKASRSGTVSCTPAGGSQYRGLRARTARAPSGCFHERLTTATV